jgi:hypothetical protein
MDCLWLHINKLSKDRKELKDQSRAPFDSYISPTRPDHRAGYAIPSMGDLGNELELAWGIGENSIHRNHG